MMGLSHLWVRSRTLDTVFVNRALGGFWGEELLETVGPQYITPRFQSRHQLC